MVTDYGEGAYILYGQAPEKPRVGWAQNGFAYSDNGTWKFLLDVEEVYGPGGDVVGWVEAGVATTNDGQFLFIIEPDA
ncbi:hypothetical protein ACX3YC_14825 [Pseudomonas mohnii]|jgi:hypothetical protein|uniref:hypothetical protein n=1 Tax=Pseudomonas rhodesiae TaxID=76760 RepID=UPI001038C8D4|nr:hypothetical protein [Pseudomonas rhodesiae]